MKRNSSIFKFIFYFLFFVSLSYLYSAVVPVNNADYLVITHSQLEEQGWIDNLISILEGRGFKVGWETLIDDAEKTSTSIKTTIQNAYNEGPPLRFVLLIGNGMNLPPSVYDPPVYKRRGVPNENVDSENGNFVPFCYEIMETYSYDDTPVPTDDAYISGLTGRCPIAIGRVPAKTDQDVLIWVNKLHDYYQDILQYNPWRNTELLLSGDVDHPSNGCIGREVSWMTELVIPFIPNYIDTVHLKASVIDPDNGCSHSEERDDIFENALNDGTFLINVFSTGAASSVLGYFYYDKTVSDYNFNNKNKYPLLFGNSCNIGETTCPLDNYNGISALYDLLFFPDGGIISSISPTVETSQWACREFSMDFHKLLYSGGFDYYGDLSRETKILFESHMPTKIWHSRSYVLFGDPSMPIGCYKFKNSNVTEDTEWCGSIIVENDITVESGAKLKIRPGTGIFFKPGASLNIKGEFVAEGMEEFPIVYSVASENIENDYWDGIEINSNEAVSIIYNVVRNAYYGLKILKSPLPIMISDSEIENCMSAGIYSENTTSNLTISGNKIQDNKGFGIWLETSYPFITYNVIKNNNWGGILANNSSNPRINKNSIIDNGFGPYSSYDGIHAMSNSHPKLYGIEEETMEICGATNWIHNNSRAGVGATLSSFPNLGIYNEILPWMFGGFNRIYGNEYDVANWNRTTKVKNIIYAQCNYWGWDKIDPCRRFYPQSIPGNVRWEPIAPVDQVQPADDPLEPILKLEMSGSYTTAIDGYETIIENNPDDEFVVLALAGIVRCYEELGDEIGLMNKMDDFMENYPGTLVEKWAKDNKLPYMIKYKEYEQALQKTDELLINFANTEREPVYIYEQGRIYEKMTEDGLGKYIEQSQLKYEKLLNEYSDSPISFIAAVKLGKKPPEQKWAFNQPIPECYALHPNYPNPFNPETNIRFDLPDASHVSLIIYDITGREVVKLVDSSKPCGYHKVIWDGKDRHGNPVSSGVYIYRIKIGAFTQAKKMVLVR
ncbi:MAG: right-handed parallel beta-helix repeat-containing protein [Candidatus Marinimicrobia bacterium]|nr:right-handed parallel beta-helix repeat-containing protein [Candidatus Neomarinimicrobiota bacterium]